MDKTRLRKLASVLENFTEERKNLVKPVKKFDMETWYTCGTAACALGTAMLHPWFRKLGLTDQEDNRSLDGNSREPAYNGKTDFSAGAEFFDIDYDEAAYLFDPYEYAMPHRPRITTVAARIREFVRVGGMGEHEVG